MRSSDAGFVSEKNRRIDLGVEYYLKPSLLLH
jgi:hypothetical protein